MKRQVVLAFLTLILVGSQLCRGQSSTQGALIGTITDQNGGVIAGASIVVRNVDTNITRQAASDDRGNYRIEFLLPGRYQITAERTGFKKTEVLDVNVDVSQLQRVDLQMAVGDVSEQVTVPSSEAASPINTESSTLGQVIDNKQIQNLPLNGREFLQLASLVPGAESGSPKRGAVYSKGFSIGFNGARAAYNSYHIDGAESTDPLYNQLVSSPALDAIREFRVETNMYSAQYGRSGGAVINIVTNSGTNNFHGSLYEYHRNKRLDAAPFFDLRPYAQRSPYLFNQFGGSLGGPITLPRFGEGGPSLKSLKNKTFFFLSIEAFREKKPGDLMVTFAPTAKERIGDVSETINPYTGQPVVLRNPYTGQIIPGNKLPPELINPAGRRLMDLWPSPNYSGDPFLNLRMFRSGTFRQNKWLVRVDHNFSAKDVINGTFDFNDYDNTSVWHTIYGDKNNLDHNRTWSGTYTHTFNTNLVNDLKLSYTRFFSGNAFNLRDKAYGPAFGLYPGTNQNLGSPRLLMYTIGYQRFDIGNDGDYVHQNHSTYVKDNLVWVKGKHTFLMGGDFLRQNFNWQYDSGQSQLYFGLLDGYPGYESYYGTTGSVFTDLLMGLNNLANYGLGGGQYMKFRRNMFSGYLQDDWKVSPRLTLNLGVRYDYEEPFANLTNEFLTLDFNTGMVRYAAGAPADKLATLKFPFETGGPNRPYNPDKKNFAPRIGFAFRPFNNNKTAVRGGYGIFYTSETAYTTMYGSWVSPFNGLVSYSPKAYFWPDNKDHFVPIDQAPYNLSYAYSKSPGFFLPNTPYYPTGYLQQYNFTLARELPFGIGFEAAYVGTKGTNLNGASSVNTYSSDLNKKVLAAIPGFSLGLRTKGFNSKYNALELKANKRLSHGLYFLAAYTWSHALAESSNDETNENLLTDTNAAGNFVARRYANADFDVRQRLSLSGGYDLPVGRGRAYGRDWGGVPNAVLGGWQLTYILTLQGGYPFTVYDSSLHFPDRVCDGNLPSSQRTADHWFDYKCFVTHTPTKVTLPNGSTTLVGVNGNAGPDIIRGPGTQRLDVGVHKNFYFTESKYLELRGEFFNVLNHPNLLAPGGNYFFNSPSGARITRVGEMRDIQVALKFIF